MCLWCFLGYGVLPDAVRAGGGDPIQAGPREKGHHQGDMVGEAPGSYGDDNWTHTLHSRATPNVKQMWGWLLKLMGNITHHTRYAHAETRRYFPTE